MEAFEALVRLMYKITIRNLTPKGVKKRFFEFKNSGQPKRHAFLFAPVGCYVRRPNAPSKASESSSALPIC